MFLELLARVFLLILIFQTGNFDGNKCLAASNGDKILSPRPNYVGTKARVKFNGSFLQ